ncbi:MAG TPA: LacI family DNA-binding transcriptional regulator [Devosiaceae bacterium]|nr:LacI family DNA-binding transcriptional regulator [Devosiaceae bacterium]
MPHEHRSPTESDVAKLAGVSQSAVSRAFTPGASIAERMRKKVLEAAAKLGYHPNLMARSLATRRSNIIGLAISNLANPFYVEVVRELSEQLRRTDRHILLFTAPANTDVDPALDRVLSYQVDALILTATTASAELAQQCQKAGVPIVQINRASKLAGVSTVRGENRKASERIAEFLLAGGHKRYAFLGGTPDSNVGKERQIAFAACLKSHGVKRVEVAFGDYTFEAAAAAARRLLNNPLRPDAIYCASDYMAFAALDVAKREFGLAVPRDVSIIGFDDVPEAGNPAHDLTTYSQPAGAFVSAAIRIIDARNAEPAGRARRVEIPGELMVRGSARVPAPPRRPEHR